MTWTPVCELAALQPERGAAAMLPDRQIALFRTSDNAVYALDNRDPFSHADVLARGIVGTRGDTPIVTSPMYKQAFDLRTGRCLDHQSVRVTTFPARVRHGQVEVRLP